MTTKCVQSNDNFSVGSSFEIIGGKNNKVLKASAVVNHYASLCGWFCKHLTEEIFNTFVTNNSSH